MSWFEIAEQIMPDVRTGDIETCVDRVTEELKKLPNSPFHHIITCRFTNRPEKVADYLTQFLRQEKERIDVQAIYTEMNGFDVNPDVWYCDVFAYEQYGGHDDYDWLSDWQSLEYEPMILTGLEDMQAVYKNFEEGVYEEIDGEYSDARDLCSLLIVLYFQDLIKTAAPFIQELRVPMLATSHGYDIIYEYRQ